MSSRKILEVFHKLVFSKNCSDYDLINNEVINRVPRIRNTLKFFRIKWYPSRFEHLPITVIYNIFKMLDKLSLVYLAHAFPQYRKMIVQPIHWSKLFLIDNTNVLNLKEVKRLINHTNICLKALAIDFDGLESPNFNGWSYDLLKLKSLLRPNEANNLISKICNSAINVKFLDIKFSSH